MGCRNSEFSEDETCYSTLSEALLFATMCLVGFPVEVHIKDGSVYSGIFHTACVENEYGVVLKKARMTKRGKRNANVDDDVVIDTLIVLSGDLVQVVATLEDVTDAAINWRQDPDNQLKKDPEDHGQEFDLHQGVNVDRVPSSILIEKPCTERPISINTTTNAFSVGVSTSSLSVVDSCMDSCHSSKPSTTDMAPSHGSESNKSGKEFKLNPRAKLFSPSVANSMSAIPAAPVAYISNNSPVLPLPAAQPEAELSPFVPHSPVPPAKFVPYGNSIAGFGGNVAQFSQPMVGHVGTRTQPFRYVGQYPFQAGPTFGPPNSPAVMVGRFGQLVYMQPLSHDLAQGTTVTSPVPPCPLLTTHPVQYPKHQGTAVTQALQFCVPQPFVASGHQPLAALPNHVPTLQPFFPLNRPMQLPEANAFFNAKF